MKKKIHEDVITGVLLELAIVFFYYKSYSIRTEDSRIFPRGTLILMAIFAGIIIFNGLRKTIAEEENTITLKGLAVPAQIFGFLVGYYFLFRLVGFFIATPIFMFVVLYRLGYRKWIKNLIIIAVFLVVVYFVFVKGLNVGINGFGYLGRLFS